MNEIVSPTHLLLDTLRATGLEALVGGHDALLQGLQEIEEELLRVAMDVCIAERRGCSLSQAAVDHETYPKLAQFHGEVDDIVLMTLPPDLARWAERVAQQPPAALFEQLGSLLVTLASREGNQLRRAMYRVLLFEVIRMSLMLLYHSSEETAAVGILPEDLSAIAEEKINVWLADPPTLDGGERPLQILLAASVEGTQQYAEELIFVLGSFQGDFVEELRWRARMTHVLATFDRQDALLIRNAMASELDERPLSVEVLQARHPRLLGRVGRNALDQRLKRFRRALARREPLRLRRRGDALIDIASRQLDDSKEKS